MTMQVAFGAAFGRWLTNAKKLTKRGIAFVSRTISSDVLEYGGLAFVIGGIAVLLYPNLINIGINTGIKIHNLDNLGIGFFLVIFAVVMIGILSYRHSIKKAIKLGYTKK